MTQEEKEQWLLQIMRNGRGVTYLPSDLSMKLGVRYLEVSALIESLEKKGHRFIFVKGCGYRLIVNKWWHYLVTSILILCLVFIPFISFFIEGVYHG